MKNPLPLAPLLLASTALLSSCAAVYVPTTPSTPLLEKGQVEVAAGLRTLRYAEAQAAWSPVAHVLLTGELATGIGKSVSSTSNGQGGTNTYEDTHGQGGLGLGLYNSSAKSGYLAVMSGIGWGRSNFFAFDNYKPASPFFPFPLPTSEGVYDARYRRYYGQVYFASADDDSGPRIGGSLRAVWLDYTRLTYADVPIVASTHVYVEPSAFLRFGQGPLRFYTAIGLSMPLGSDRANPSDNRTSSTSYLLSAGIILRPDLLIGHKK
ncbi:hypothetical protein [Hymenobacter rubidus]|uniref:hypothetical protein n=1 Tax=Hymenobacter rubidus TaxID=1441626 RepID=UPI00191DE963|nr:hypothetical protein [Hymenobacter rubidus]